METHSPDLGQGPIEINRSPMIYMTIPCPLYHQDAQLDCMSRLAYVMNDMMGALDEDERIQVADWFHQRYSKKDEK